MSGRRAAAPPTHLKGWLQNLALIGLSLGSIEGGARVVERLTPAAPAYGPFAVRDGLKADAVTGEPRPSFFVEESGSLTIRTRYTGPSGGCYPFHCQSIPPARFPGEYRIGCLGSSSTNGRDLLPASSRARGLDFRRGEDWGEAKPFCDILRSQIQALLPGRSVTAYNLGADTLDSARILPVVRECARRIEWDLWVVYMGHNEFNIASELVQPFENSRVLAAALELDRALAGRLAFYRTLRRSNEWLRARHPGRVRAYAPNVFVEREDYGDRYERAVVGYEARLREIAGMARRAGVTLVLSEVVSNHEWLDDNDDLAFQCFRRGVSAAEVGRANAAFRVARELERAGRTREAIAAYLRAEAVEPGYLPVLLGLARCHVAAGDRARALVESIRAQAENPVPGVVTPRLTDALRRVGREMGVPVAAQIERFERLYLQGSDYASLFVDDCHPSAAGHRLIAQGLLSALVEAGEITRLAHAAPEGRPHPIWNAAGDPLRDPGQ